MTADLSIVQGMLPVLEQRGRPIDAHLETFLPDRERDPHREHRFEVGNIRRFNNRSSQSRRFSMVQSADVVVSIEGARGTRSVLDVALALERPALPLPFEGRSDRTRDGASCSTWKSEHGLIQRWFRLGASEVSHFDSIVLNELDAPAIQSLAQVVFQCLVRGFTQGCFVIMRFHEDTDPFYETVIAPALRVHGFEAWRTDRSVTSGDVVQAIRDGIEHCYFALVDTTGDRPNVMYELGLAHAARKPVILLRKLNPDGSLPKTPFDFQTHSILYYSDNWDDIRTRLEGAISVMGDRASQDAG